MSETDTLPCTASVAMTGTTFNDLNDDVLRQIAFWLTPSDTGGLGYHWLNLPWESACKKAIRDVRALRAACRQTRAAISPPWIDVEVRDTFDVHERLAQWAHAPDEVLSHVRRISFPPSGRTDNFVSPGEAQACFAQFTTLLIRARNLVDIHIEHNPFCPHDAYGLGRERIFALGPDPTGSTPQLTSVRSLCVALKCRVCAVELARTLAGWCPSLEALRCAVVTFVPPALVIPPLVRRVAEAPLRTLHLKVGEDWRLPALLRTLAPCKFLAELHIAPYNASRKVEVVENVQPEFGSGNDIEGLLNALSLFPNLEELDLCLAPSAVDPSLSGVEEGSAAWREGAVRAAERLRGACPGLQRGWWWVQVVDLDYRQLKGYQRWGWQVWGDGDGEVLLDQHWRWLAPLIVRNQDGQGTTVAMPSEDWQ